MKTLLITLIFMSSGLLHAKVDQATASNAVQKILAKKINTYLQTSKSPQATATPFRKENCDYYPDLKGWRDCLKRNQLGVNKVTTTSSDKKAFSSLIQSLKNENLIYSVLAELNSSSDTKYTTSDIKPFSLDSFKGDEKINALLIYLSNLSKAHHDDNPINHERLAQSLFRKNNLDRSIKKTCDDATLAKVLNVNVSYPHSFKHLTGFPIYPKKTRNCYEGSYSQDVASVDGTVKSLLCEAGTTCLYKSAIKKQPSAVSPASTTPVILSLPGGSGVSTAQ